ncbi:DNA replication endonuclease-helicase Dna2 [Naganishia albida]|nr:DNA replication endonuclease-helicase Dna2 [Naganishia albida]
MECRVVESAQAAIANGRASGIACPDRRIRCVLKGEWAGIVLETGDFVNIISAQVADGRLAIPVPTHDAVDIEFSHLAPKNSLIAHPDILYPMKTLARAVSCPRRPLVTELVKTNGITANSKVLYGNLQHELFQTMLKTRQFSPGGIQAHLDALLHTPEYQLEMWSCGLKLEEVRTRVGCKARSSLAAFGDKWVGGEPKSEAMLQDSHSAATLAITGLHDIEESILSPFRE